MTETLLYTADRIPEIADDILNVDNAMKWGFAWKMGPFESWDAIGVKGSSEKMKAAGYKIPTWVQEMLAGGKESFYKRSEGSLFTMTSHPGTTNRFRKTRDYPSPLPQGEKEEGDGNKGASLIDIGDGVACLEFHTKMNAMGEDIVNMIYKSADIVSRDFLGLSSPITAKISPQAPICPSSSLPPRKRNGMTLNGWLRSSRMV